MRIWPAGLASPQGRATLAMADDPQMGPRATYMYVHAPRGASHAARARARASDIIRGGAAAKCGLLPTSRDMLPAGTRLALLMIVFPHLLFAHQQTPVAPPKAASEL